MVLGTGNQILAGAPITVLWRDDCYDDEGKTVDARRRRECITVLGTVNLIRALAGASMALLLEERGSLWRH